MTSSSPHAIVGPGPVLVHASVSPPRSLSACIIPPVHPSLSFCFPSMATNAIANGNGQANLDALRQDEQHGRVAVHSFDPDTPPKEKAAIAGQARDQLKSVTGKSAALERGMAAHCPFNPVYSYTGAEVAVDTGNSSAVPTITINGTDTAHSPIKDDDVPQAPVASPSEPLSPPGALPDGPAPSIPDWYRVGWRAVSGIDDPPLPEGAEKDKGVLEQFISDQYYGTWYHNAALIVAVRVLPRTTYNLYAKGHSSYRLSLSPIS